MDGRFKFKFLGFFSRTNFAVFRNFGNFFFEARTRTSKRTSFWAISDRFVLLESLFVPRFASNSEPDFWSFLYFKTTN